MVVLWVLKGSGEPEGSEIRESIGFNGGNGSSRKDIPEQGVAGGIVGTRVALVFR